MNSNFETCYVSCGCNKTPHAADWGRNGLICYAACHSIAVYDPLFAGGGGKILHTLHGHQQRINSVRWLKNYRESAENELISASADGTSILWSWKPDENIYVQEATLTGHSNIVNIADGYIRLPPRKQYVPNNSALVLATASVDSTVMVWRRNEGEEKIRCVDILEWGSGFCLDVRLAPLPETSLVLLACAADDNNIHLFAETHHSELEDNTSGHGFIKVHVLVGHTDWVRAMDFIIDVYNDLYLATGSQDTYIRVYKFHQKPKQAESTKIIKKVAVNGTEDLLPEEKLITVGVTYNEHHFAITLETVLAGHEGWVYGVSWHPPVYKLASDLPAEDEIIGGMKTQKIELLSTSMDKTMIVWAPNISGVWLEKARLGEVGGNTLGFYGGKMGMNGQGVMAHGYQGSFHIWKYDKENKTWEPNVVVGGHVGPVMDLAWDLDGNYILTVGGDQTTRLHAPWVKNDEHKTTWHELSRPQIHGYDMTCVAILSKYKFASGAEEKVIRAFTAPNNFIENFRRISRIPENEDEKLENGPQGASVPALGLSNKPVFDELKKEGCIVADEYPDLYFSPLHLEKPPTEENLMQNTLWPETQKLYGHGYEIFSLAARHDGVVLASSSKATTPEHAAIILWNAKTWLQIQKLPSHQLTVTQLSFSPDGSKLLSVSRDRRWSLFKVREDGKTYELITTTDVKNNLHTRIIWCCAWTFDSVAFATGSRDGKVGFWSQKSQMENQTDDPKQSVELLASIELQKESVTALAFAPFFRRGHHIVAIGLEKGAVHLYRYLDKNVENLWVIFQGNLGHHLTVKRLAFRPKVGRTGVQPNGDADQSSVIQLASCGADYSLKVYDIFIHLL